MLSCLLSKKGGGGRGRHRKAVESASSNAQEEVKTPKLKNILNRWAEDRVWVGGCGGSSKEWCPFVRRTKRKEGAGRRGREGGRGRRGGGAAGGGGWREREGGRKRDMSGGGRNQRKEGLSYAAPIFQFTNKRPGLPIKHKGRIYTKDCNSC